MGMVRVNLHDSQGFAKVEGYCLYAAFAEPQGDIAAVKVGISMRPLLRIYEVHCGNQHPIDLAVWTHVGSKSAAMSAERTILSRLSEFKTRGEWLLLNIKSPDHKAKFNAVCRAAFARATGRRLVWRKTSIEQVKTACNLERLR